MKRGVIVLLCLVFLSSFSFASEIHDASDFYLSVDGVDYDLQTAYDNSLLNGGHVYSGSSSEIVFGHSVEGIWASTESGEMSFLDALNNGVSYKTQAVTTYLSVSSELVSHYATDVIFSDKDSLQDKINGVSFCSSDFGDICGKTDCVNPGTIQCDGSCAGTTNKAAGTSCGTSKTCDGSGSCIKTGIWYRQSCGADQNVGDYGCSSGVPYCYCDMKLPYYTSSNFGLYNNVGMTCYSYFKSMLGLPTSSPGGTTAYTCYDVGARILCGGGGYYLCI